MQSSSARRRRSLKVAVPSIAVVVAAVPTVLLAQQPAGATFTASTNDTGNKVTAAANFCVAVGSTTTITPPQDDAWIDQANPDTNHYTGKLQVQAGSGGSSTGGAGTAQRAYVRFTDPSSSLPAPPHDCTLTGATLRLYDDTPTGGRTIDVYRVDPSLSWGANTLTWNNRATALATPIASSTAPASAGWQTWNVLTMVQAMYAYGATGGDNGFQLRDHLESTTTGNRQIYDDLLGTNPGQLVLTWG